MSQAATAKRSAEAVRPKTALTVLLVSEDPETVVEVQQALKPAGIRVIGCMGPAHGPCYLDEHAVCPFALHADVAVIHPPTSGVFSHYADDVGAGLYGERLARKHPDLFVVLADGIPGSMGPAGEVAHVRDMESAVDLVWAIATHPARRSATVVPLTRKEEE